MRKTDLECSQKEVMIRILNNVRPMRQNIKFFAIVLIVQMILGFILGIIALA